MSHAHVSRCACGRYCGESINLILKIGVSVGASCGLSIDVVLKRGVSVGASHGLSVNVALKRIVCADPRLLLCIERAVK